VYRGSAELSGGGFCWKKGVDKIFHVMLFYRFIAQIQIYFYKTGFKSKDRRWSIEQRG
jgi:hypothetical protein